MKRLVGLLIAMSITAIPAAAQTTNSGQPATIADAASQEVAPAHAHTGWATLLKDTAEDFVALPQRKSTWTLLGIGAAVALATRPADRYVESHVVGSKTADNVFSLGQIVGNSYVQMGSAIGLWGVGRYIIAPVADESRTNKYSEMGFDLIRAQILSQALVQGLKYSVRRDRPTGECCAFPSGHAATAFAAASVFERHLGHRGSWPALAGATYVAASRLVDNRHFLSDIGIGAAIGIASGWTVVGTHGRNRYALQPVPVPGGMMIALTRSED